MAKVAAVILAAGGSSRFGKPKQLIELRDKTLLRRILDAAAEANCSPIVVVIGSAMVEVRKELETTIPAVVENENWQRGIGTSIRAGVQHVIDGTSGVDAIVLLVCDQPFVDAALIKQLVRLRAQTKKTIVASSYSETFGVPALFDRSCFPELLALDDESGAKAIILSNPERVAELPFPQGKIDIDTIEDWKTFETLLRSG
jgi:molybdenum cofactor cytidylyltransferase